MREGGEEEEKNKEKKLHTFQFFTHFPDLLQNYCNCCCHHPSLQKIKLFQIGQDYQSTVKREFVSVMTDYDEIKKCSPNPAYI